MTGLRKLLAFAHTLALDSLGQEVVRHAKLIVLDSLGIMIHGNQTAEAAGMAQRSDGSGVPILGTTFQANPPLAAMINSLGMVSQELDEGNAKAKGHPACHILPALLSIGYARDLSGRELLAALVAGYEVNVRIGSAVQLKAQIHPHGNWGMIGGGAAVAKLVGCSQAQMEQAVALSCSLPAVSLWEAALAGQRIRDVYVGTGSLINCLVPDLAASGYTGSLDHFGTIYREILGDRVDEENLVESLGEHFFLQANYFKQYPYCRFCHGPMEAVETMLKAHKPDVDAIRQINVHTYHAAARLSSREAKTDFGEKFSIPLAIASVLEPLGRHKRKQDFANVTHVYEDERMNAALPNQRNCHVELVMADGLRYSHLQVGAKGDPTDPFLPSEIESKLQQLVRPVLGEERFALLLEAVEDIERRSVREIVQLCVPTRC